MKQKNHLPLNRSARDISRPAVFLNNTQKKAKFKGSVTAKVKLPHK